MRTSVSVLPLLLLLLLVLLVSCQPATVRSDAVPVDIVQAAQSARAAAQQQAPTDAPAVPVWPSRYHFTGTFSMPAFDVNEVLEAWVDTPEQRQKLSYFHGMDVYLYLYKKRTSYGVVPSVDRLLCQEVPTAGGPTLASAAAVNVTGPPPADGPMIPLVPDLTQPGWSFVGTSLLRGEIANMWHYQYEVVDQHESFLENVTNSYTLYTSASSHVPLLFLMEGFDFVFGSHPDIYVIEYYTFDSAVGEADFVVPSVCDKDSASRDLGLAPVMQHLRAQLARMSPPVRPTVPAAVDPLLARFHQFVRRYGKHYDHPAEHDQRFEIFKQNLKYIETHNQRSDVSYKLGLNHLADLTEDEYRSMLFPQADRPSSFGSAATVHQRTRSVEDLPTSIDWREKGAVSIVKDQAACGSCWSFSATGSLEGRWKIKTGKMVWLSEQQIIDCAWGYEGSQACGGGFSSGAFQWIMDNGGIARETTYRYLGQDGWCNAHIRDSGVTVQSYVNVTAFNELDLQDAVVDGPVSIAIDASHNDFRFYRSGIYVHQHCYRLPELLDHAVLAVGYGTDPEFGDYWIVKNSWSPHWGDDGYVKMVRNHQDACGVATQASYPVV